MDISGVYLHVCQWMCHWYWCNTGKIPCWSTQAQLCSGNAETERSLRNIMGGRRWDWGVPYPNPPFDDGHVPGVGKGATNYCPNVGRCKPIGKGGEGETSEKSHFLPLPCPATFLWPSIGYIWQPVTPYQPPYKLCTHPHHGERPLGTQREHFIQTAFCPSQHVWQDTSQNSYCRYSAPGGLQAHPTGTPSSLPQ